MWICCVACRLVRLFYEVLRCTPLRRTASQPLFDVEPQVAVDTDMSSWLSTLGLVTCCTAPGIARAPPTRRNVGNVHRVVPADQIVVFASGGAPELSRRRAGVCSLSFGQGMLPCGSGDSSQPTRSFPLQASETLQ
jgi:hypothetical protein